MNQAIKEKLFNAFQDWNGTILLGEEIDDFENALNEVGLEIVEKPTKYLDKISRSLHKIYYTSYKIG